MSRPRTPLKRTRPSEFLRKQAARRATEQRRVDEQMRKLVSWTRSK